MKDTNLSADVRSNIRTKGLRRPREEVGGTVRSESQEKAWQVNTPLQTGKTGEKAAVYGRFEYRAGGVQGARGRPGFLPVIIRL